MPRNKTILAILCLTILCATYVFAQEPKDAMRHHGKQVMENKEHKLEARIAQLTSKLKLTPEQGAKIKEILTSSHNEATAIFEEAKARVKEIRKKEHEEIKALLNEEQQKKFQHSQCKHKNCPHRKECLEQDKE